MKKPTLLLFSLFACSSLLFSGCQTNDPIEHNTKPDTNQAELHMSKMVWETLTDSEKEEIIGSWKDAEISKVIVDKSRFFLLDPSFDGQEVTMVTFRSKRSALLGDISKLVDEKSGKVIGGAFRE